MGEKGDNICDSDSKMIVYLDGTRPAYASCIPKCPHCGGGMYLGKNLIRCFDEDTDPGPAIQEAWKTGEFVNPPPGPPDPTIAAMLVVASALHLRSKKIGQEVAILKRLLNRNKMRWIFGAMAVGFLMMLILALFRT